MSLNLRIHVLVPLAHTARGTSTFIMYQIIPSPAHPPGRSEATGNHPTPVYTAGSAQSRRGPCTKQ